MIQKCANCQLWDDDSRFLHTGELLNTKHKDKYIAGCKWEWPIELPASIPLIKITPLMMYENEGTDCACFEPREP